MTNQQIVLKELSGFFSALAHPARAQIIFELEDKELSVSELQKALKLKQPAVSQHLALLKSHHLLKERKDGRHCYYSLEKSKLASWLYGALPFMMPDEVNTTALISAIESMNSLCSTF